MGVAYAKIREQFGQPIGGFQAIKHHCADMAARAEAAYSASVFAALSVVAGRSDATFQAASARIVAADAAIRNAATNIQVHGGIGFTAECDANLFLKRAHLLEKIGGATRGQQRLLAEQQAAE
jgi:alkylation response protein AidB-like acyl-CoA dehydrogenase